MATFAPNYHYFIRNFLTISGKCKYGIKLIDVSKSFLEAMKLKAGPLRADYRRFKSDIDTEAKAALLLSDLSLSDICIEIKVNIF